MLGETLIKLISVLTPDDVSQMRAAGCGDVAGEMIDNLDKLRLRWLEREYHDTDRKLWIDISTRLNELRAALHQR